METATKEQISEWLSDKNEDNMMNIIKQYDRFVKSIVSKICRTYNCYENYNDFIQEAHIPLIKTYWDYDKDKGADFTTILKIRIEGYIQQMYNENYRLVAVPKSAFIKKSVDNISILYNEYYDINSPSIRSIPTKYKDECVSNTIRKKLKLILTPKQYYIIANNNGFDNKIKLSATKIGEHLGLCRKTVEAEIFKIKNIIAQNKNIFKGDLQ